MVLDKYVLSVYDINDRCYVVAISDNKAIVEELMEEYLNNGYSCNIELGLDLDELERV